MSDSDAFILMKGGDTVPNCIFCGAENADDMIVCWRCARPVQPAGAIPVSDASTGVAEVAAPPAPSAPEGAAPTAQQPAAVARAEARPAPSHGVARIIVPIAIAVVLLGGLGAGAFIVFTKVLTPERTVTGFLEALKANNVEAMKKCVTKESRAELEKAQRGPGMQFGASPMMPSGQKAQVEYQITSTKYEGAEARVMVKFKSSGGFMSMEMDIPFICKREGLFWKIDLKRTNEEQLKALMSGPFGTFIKAFEKAFKEMGKSMAEQMGKSMKEALEKAKPPQLPKSK